MVSVFGERAEQEGKVGGTIKNGCFALWLEGQLTAVKEKEGENERGRERERAEGERVGGEDH